MCGYSTFEQYAALGGKADASAFPRLSRLAQNIQLCMMLIMDALQKVESGESNIASTSNDGLSISYASARTEEQIMGSVYDQVVEILPVELVNLGVGS